MLGSSTLLDYTYQVSCWGEINLPGGWGRLLDHWNQGLSWGFTELGKNRIFHVKRLIPENLQRCLRSRSKKTHRVRQTESRNAKIGIATQATRSENTNTTCNIHLEVLTPYSNFCSINDNVGLFFLYNTERHFMTTISIKSLMLKGTHSNYVSSGLESLLAVTTWSQQQGSSTLLLLNYQ